MRSAWEGRDSRRETVGAAWFGEETKLGRFWPSRSTSKEKSGGKNTRIGILLGKCYLADVSYFATPTNVSLAVGRSARILKQGWSSHHFVQEFATFTNRANGEHLFSPSHLFLPRSSRSRTKSCDLVISSWSSSTITRRGSGWRS